MFDFFAMLLLWAFMGIGIGIITGLLPALHVNSIALMMFGATIQFKLDPFLVSIFIIAMDITNSFFEFLPSIFFGAPDSDTSLSVLPGHKMLLEGRGYEALLFTISGGLFGIIILTAFSPLLFFSIPQLYAIIKPNIHIILIILMSFMILIEKNKIRGLFVFFLASLYGLIAMSLPINKNYSLLPILSGLFGISTLLLSLNSCAKVPEQKLNPEISKSFGIKGSIVGFFGGLIAGILPGLGSAQAAVLVQESAQLKNEKIFLTAQGAINITNISLSILALYLIGNPRSGSAVVIGNIINGLTLEHVLFFLATAVFAAGVAAVLILKIGKILANVLANLNYRSVSIVVLIFIMAMIYYFVGIIGLFIACIGTSIGILPHLLNVKKSLCLGCLIVPTILFFVGLTF